jgi:hypothetical protein
METGEIIEVDQITKRALGQKQFWKLYLMDFLQVLGILDSRQIDILVYIMENTEPANNMFVGTYTKIHENTGASSRTIARVMTKLQETGFIRKIQNGAWTVSPRIMMKGNDHKKQMLISYYDDLPGPDKGLTQSKEIQETRRNEMDERTNTESKAS